MVCKRGRLPVLPALCVLFLVLPLTVAVGQAAPPSVNQDFLDGVNLVRDQKYDEALKKLQAAVATDPKLEPAWHYIGVCQFELGKDQEAVAALQKAIELRPDRPESRLYVGRIYESLGAFDEAVGVYQEELRIQIGTDPTDAFNALARGYRLAGRNREAMEAAYQATLRDKKYVEALYNWALAADADGDYKTAMEKLEKGREILFDWTDLQLRLQRLTQERRVDPELTEEHVVQEYGRAETFATELGLWPALNKAHGMAAMHNGQQDLARISFRRALEPAERGNPDDADALTLIGVAYYEEARDLLIKERLLFQPIDLLNAAAKSLQDTLKKSPNYAPAHNALGEVYLVQAETFVSDPGRGIVSHTFEEADAEFQEALKADPQYVDAMVNLAVARIGQQRYSEAVQQLNRALAVQPNRADLHAELARAYVGLERFDQAREEAGTAIQLDRKQIAAYNAAGLAAYYVGDLGSAVEMYGKALEIDSTAHQSHTNLGLAFFQMRSWNRAREEFQLALKYLPEASITNTAIQRSYILYLVGLTYSNTNLHDRAVRSLNEALAIDPTYFDALRQVARDYAALTDFRASERALRRALQQSPGAVEDAEVLAQLGQVYETAGQPHEALAAYGEALTKDPNNLEAQSGLTRLQAS
jgi:tetratricopeptide (TPR) repeat protein